MQQADLLCNHFKEQDKCKEWMNKWMKKRIDKKDRNPPLIYTAMFLSTVT